MLLPDPGPGSGNAILRGDLCRILQQEGYGVTLAANGQEALIRLRSGPRPDLILLDMLMPVLDGWHFLEKFQKEGPTPPVPVLVTTGTNLTSEWAESKGCQGFLRKPVSPESLLAEVRRCLA